MRKKASHDYGRKIAGYLSKGKGEKHARHIVGFL